MAISRTMTFTQNGNVLTLPAPDPGSIKRTPEVVQNVVNSASGGIFVDDKNVTRYFVEFTVTMTHAQAVDFDAFYRTMAQGALNTFTWLDHENRSWGGCRFEFEGEPTMTRTAGKLYRLTIRLRTGALFGS